MHCEMTTQAQGTKELQIRFCQMGSMKLETWHSLSFPVVGQEGWQK